MTIPDYITDMGLKMWEECLQAVDNEDSKSAITGSIKIGDDYIEVCWENIPHCGPISIPLGKITTVSEGKFSDLEDSASKTEEGLLLHGILISLRDRIKKHEGGNIEKIYTANVCFKDFEAGIEIFFEEAVLELGRLEEESLPSDEKKSSSPKVKHGVSYIIKKGYRVMGDDLVTIRKAITDDPNKLFDMKIGVYITRFMFFSAIEYQAEADEYLSMVKDMIRNFSKLNQKNQKIFINFLFQESKTGSMFQRLTRESDCNEVFDEMRKFVDNDFIIEAMDSTKKQVLDFAYSLLRYNHIFTKTTDLSPDTVGKAKEALQKCRRKNLSGLLSKNRRDSVAFERWLTARTTGSSSISQSHRDTALCSRNWRLADKKVSELAAQYKRDNTVFELKDILMIHKILTKGELGIEHPGELRETDVACSSGLYCRGRYLKENFSYFMSWINEGLSECRNNRRNPIIFAAQVCERIVSFHPFENGNGRLSRLIAAFVLESFDIAPPILGSDFNIACFPLDSLSKVRKGEQSPDALVLKFIAGVEESEAIIDKIEKRELGG